MINKDKKMPSSKKTVGTTIEGLWNGLSSFERINVVRENPDLFISAGLATRDEIEKIMACSESDVEYLAETHPEILLREIDITDTVRHQEHSKELRTAVSAVFSKRKAA